MFMVRLPNTNFKKFKSTLHNQKFKSPGVRTKYLNIGDHTSAASFTKGAYFVGKMAWPKGLGELFTLMDYVKQRYAFSIKAHFSTFVYDTRWCSSIFFQYGSALSGGYLRHRTSFLGHPRYGRPQGHSGKTLSTATAYHTGESCLQYLTLFFTAGSILWRGGPRVTEGVQGVCEPITE